MKQAETAAVARNAVIYARYSSHNQTEQSIEGQLRVCHEYAQREGFTIVGEYIDRAISGKTDDRPDFQRMISDSRKRAFQYVIVYKLDRFARNRYDSAVYKHKLKQNGVKVVSAMENIGDNPEGIILEAVLEASAEYYSLELAQKIKRGKRESAMKGQFNGGTPPFGYRSVDRRLVIDEAKAPFVKRAFEQYAAGVPKKRIVAELNAAGLRNRNGKPFGHTALQVALQNEKYIGIQRFSDIVIEDACPALVDRETFDKVQERIKQNRREGGKNKAKMEYLLTGKAFCGYCGSTITGVSSKGRHNEPHYYYACRNRRLGNGCKKAYEKKDFLEWYVVEQTVEYVLTPSRIQEIAAAVVAEYDREFNDTRIKELERQIARLERDIDKLTDSILDVPKSAWAGIGQKIETATMQKNDLEIDLSKLRIANKIRYTESDIVVWLKSFCKGDLFDMEFRRRIIDTFINSVYLYDDRVIVFYNIRGGKQVSYIDMLDATEGFPGLDDEPAPGDSGESPDAKEKPDTTSGVRLLNASHQLRIMALDEYRPKMAGLLLGKGYQPPDPRIPDSDSLLSDGKTRLPFVAAVDVDLKRIDRAYRAAREAGYPKLALGALEPQAKALQLLYQVTGKAVVYSVAIPDLLKSLWESGQQELANTLRLYEPPPTAYITQEGGALHASAVPSHRKAGEPYRPEIWPVDGPEG